MRESTGCHRLRRAGRFAVRRRRHARTGRYRNAEPYSLERLEAVFSEHMTSMLLTPTGSRPVVETRVALAAEASMAKRSAVKFIAVVDSDSATWLFLTKREPLAP